MTEELVEGGNLGPICSSCHLISMLWHCWYQGDKKIEVKAWDKNRRYLSILMNNCLCVLWPPRPFQILKNTFRAQVRCLNELDLPFSHSH